MRLRSTIWYRERAKLTWLQYSATQCNHVDSRVGAPQRDEHVEQQLHGLPIEQALEPAVVDQIPDQHAAGDRQLVGEDNGRPRTEYDGGDDASAEAAEHRGG